MKTRIRGFTLLELMVVLVIASVLLAIGIPSMGNFFRNARMTAAANDLLAALYLARTEAIKRRTPVTVCASANPLAASPSCSASDALTGWVVFVDNNADGQWDSAWTFNDIDGDGNKDVAEVDLNGDGWNKDDPLEDIDDDDHQDVAEVDVAEDILYRREPLPTTISARGSANPLRITYLDTGFMQSPNAGRIVFCDSRGNVASGGEPSAARAVTVSVTGRPNVSRDKTEIQSLIALLGGTIGGCSS